MLHEPSSSITWPAVGKHQIICGVLNGIWHTWQRVDGKDLRALPHSSQEDALKVYEALKEAMTITGIIKPVLPPTEVII